MRLDCITVTSNYRPRECLFIHPDAAAAQEAIDGSPWSDGVMMSTTTWHRAAKMSDIRRLRYDQNGEEINLHTGEGGFLK
jgi:hypothetical protein